MANRNYLSFNLTAQGDDAASQILSEAMKKYPKFAEHFDQEDEDASLGLQGQSRCVLQTLIIFFLTGKYQGEHEEPCRCESGFGHAVQVYQFSVGHDLDELADLAAEQFHELGETKTFGEIMGEYCYAHNIFNEDERYLELANYFGERAREFGENDEKRDRHIDLYDEDTKHTLFDTLLETILLQRHQIQELLSQVAKEE